MGLIDIIVIVLVVVIVVTRFTKFKLPTDMRDKTARRADLDRLRGRPLVRDEPAKVVDITSEAEMTPVKSARKPNARDLQDAAKNLSGMAKLKVLEPGFDEAGFVDGAKAAYTYFYGCWNARDEEGLDNLCAPAMFDKLMTELHDDSVWKPVQVDEIAAAQIADVRVHGKTVLISVAFESVQREGDSVPRTVKSTWLLAKPLGSEDPNWELQDIKTGMDA